MIKLFEADTFMLLGEFNSNELDIVQRVFCCYQVMQFECSNKSIIYNTIKRLCEKYEVTIMYSSTNYVKIPKLDKIVYNSILEDLNKILNKNPEQNREMHFKQFLSENINDIKSRMDSIKLSSSTIESNNKELDIPQDCYLKLNAIKLSILEEMYDIWCKNNDIPLNERVYNKIFSKSMPNEWLRCKDTRENVRYIFLVEELDTCEQISKTIKSKDIKNINIDKKATKKESSNHKSEQVTLQPSDTIIYNSCPKDDNGYFKN